jgi:uncharacterized membrane protein YjgN (DUF898 family)
MGKSTTFRFDGGAGSYLGVGILALLLTLFTLGLGAPWAVVKWVVENTDFDHAFPMPSA